MTRTELPAGVVVDAVADGAPPEWFCTREHTFFVDRSGTHHSDPTCGLRWRRHRSVRGVQVVALPADRRCGCLHVPAEVFDTAWAPGVYDQLRAVSDVASAAGALARVGSLTMAAEALVTLGTGIARLSTIPSTSQVARAQQLADHALDDGAGLYPNLVDAVTARYGDGPQALVGFADDGGLPEDPLLAAVVVLARRRLGNGRTRVVVALPGPVAVELCKTPGVQVAADVTVEQDVVGIAEVLWGTGPAFTDLATAVAAARALRC